MFVLWQEWLWPTWTPACLVTRPLRLLSVSGNICWTWSPPVLFPKLQTHGNNAILLPTDVTTLSFLNINSNHTHYHSDLFYGLCLCQQWSLGRIRFVFFLHILISPPPPPQTSSFEAFWNWSCSTTASEIQCWINYDYLFWRLILVWVIPTHLQQRCRSLFVYRLNLPIAPRGCCHTNARALLLLEQEGIKTDLYSIFVSPPAQTLACVGPTELNGGPQHKDCRASRDVHKILTASALQKLMKF